MSHVKVYFGIGSNLNKVNALRFAYGKLKEAFPDFKISSVYQSYAVREAEPDYYNCVGVIDTTLSLEEVYNKVQAIENEAGVELMFHNGTNFGNKRRIDIDVLSYGDHVGTEPCKVPRHDIQDYPFVLCPLTELDPDYLHPLLKIRAKEIWGEMRPRLPEKMHVTKVDFDFTKEFVSWDCKD